MEIPEIIFKTTLPIQIRFNDLDALGHVNNNMYFSFFDLGKINYFEKVKASKFSWMEGTIVVARIETDFYSPIYYKEPIVVDTKVARLGNKSGTFVQQIRNVKTDEVKCRCTSTFVAYNPDIQASMLIPDAWREAIEEYEDIASAVTDVK